MIRQWQEIIYGGNYHSAHLLGPDLAKLAEAYGIPAFRATQAGRGRRRPSGPPRPSTARPWSGSRSPRTQNVFPMMPAGKGLSDLIENVGRRRTNERLTRCRPSTPARAAHARRPRHAARRAARQHRHVLVAIVLNRPGVLNRVASLMRARNFNIESLAVSHTDQPDVSRMTITLRGDDVAVEQVSKQLYRLIDVLKVQDLTDEPTVEHELALVKVRATDRNRAEIAQDRRAVQGPRRRPRPTARSSSRRPAPRRRSTPLVALLARLRHQGARPHRAPSSWSAARSSTSSRIERPAATTER